MKKIEKQKLIALIMKKKQNDGCRFKCCAWIK